MARLGYSRKEALHIYIGEYIEQFEIYKKYHNMYISGIIYKEENNEKESAEELPEWYLEAQKGK